MNSIDSDPFLHCTQKFKFHNIREPAHSFNSFRIQLSINDVYTYRHMILYTFTYCQLLSHIIYIIYMIPQRTKKTSFLGIALVFFGNHPYAPQRPQRPRRRLHDPFWHTKPDSFIQVFAPENGYLEDEISFWGDGLYTRAEL